jgi:YggT family protein
MTVRRTARAAEQGVSGLIGLVVYYASGILLIALIVRVVGSWLGLGPFHRWMRPFYALTDWIVKPLQRVVPPLGMIDITPIIAWFLILLLRGMILGLL